jgi:hypothetical protein
LIKANVHNYFKHAKRLLKHHQFASGFEHWNFASNGILKGKKSIIQFILLPLWFFKRCFFLKSIIHTPCDSFYCVCTQFMNFEPTWSYKIEIRTLKPIVFEVIKLKPLFNLQPLRL